MTESEILFEDIFSERGIEFHKIPRSPVPKEKTPDYQVILEGVESYWEIKELEENEDEQKIISALDEGSNRLYSVNSERIKNSIKSACVQFKSYGVVDKSCVVVVHDARPFEVRDMLFYPYVWEAMLGKGEYQQLYDGSITELKRSGALLTRANKRYVSAVVVIHKATKEAVFVHNPNANISLLKSKFRELFSNHYVANFSSKGLEWEKI